MIYKPFPHGDHKYLNKDFWYLHLCGDFVTIK